MGSPVRTLTFRLIGRRRSERQMSMRNAVRSSLTRFGHTTITRTVLSLFDAANDSEHAATTPYIWAMPKV
jgi:hypothetical protein